MKFIITLFILLHGWVHAWYLLLAGNIVKYTPDMGWTGHSWLLSGYKTEAAFFAWLLNGWHWKK